MEREISTLGFGFPEGIRCGIDMVSVERISRLDQELEPEELERIFGAHEIAQCRAERFPERQLAVRFAAKEACLKLFPEEVAAGDLGVEDIDVRKDPDGNFRIEPGLRLLKAMKNQGVARIAVSTAFCRTQACAIAVVASSLEEAKEYQLGLLRAAQGVRALNPSICGRIIYRLFPVRRRTILTNMRRVFGDLLTGDEYRKLAQVFYSHMLQFILEAITYTLKPIRRIAEQVRVENIEIPLRAAQEGKGLIILTAHTGNWEITCAGSILKFPQYRGKFHFLRRPISIRLIDGLVLRRFRRVGLNVIPKRNSLLDILNVLERNEALVYIMDQHASIRKDGIPVEFFGELAGTFRSLALIAKASGAPVIPAHSWRENGIHVLRFGEPIPWIDCKDPDEEVYRNTRAYNAALEKMILKHPDQWLWMHRRWKLARLGPDFLKSPEKLSCSRFRSRGSRKSGSN